MVTMVLLLVLRLLIIFPAKIIYTVGSDGEVKEIVNGIVRTAQQVDHDGLDSIVLSNSNMMLFVSGKNGTLFSVKVPLKETPDFYEFNFHNHVVPNVSQPPRQSHILTNVSSRYASPSTTNTS